MSDHHINKLSNARDLTPEERSWIEKLLSVNFPGRDELLEQVESLKVKGTCLCGCKTIDILVDPSSSEFPFSVRVPVQMIVSNSKPKSTPVIFYLHVVEGYIVELEVFSADSEPITGKIDLDNAKVSVNL